MALFSIEGFEEVNNSIIAITKDTYEILVYCDEPILYTGFNIDGKRVIGSICCEDDEGYEDERQPSWVIRHTLAMPSNDNFKKYANGEICYLSLLETCDILYACDQKNDVFKTWAIPFDKYPKDVLPYRGILNDEIIKNA